MLRGRECIFCGDGYLHHEGTSQSTRTKPVQKDMERLSSGTGFGEKMAKYMRKTRIMIETLQSKRYNPCKGCTDRYPACSDHCKKPEYLAGKEEQATIKRNRDKYQTPIWKHGDRDHRRK